MIDTTFPDPGTNGGQPAKETQTHKPGPQAEKNEMLTTEQSDLQGL